jgi:predicted transcriptional regulator
MANQPKTPHRTIRVDDALWTSAQLAAAERGESVSDVIRAALARYVKRTAANR